MIRTRDQPILLSHRLWEQVRRSKVCRNKPNAGIRRWESESDSDSDSDISDDRSDGSRSDSASDSESSDGADMGVDHDVDEWSVKKNDWKLSEGHDQFVEKYFHDYVGQTALKRLLPKRSQGHHMIH